MEIKNNNKNDKSLKIIDAEDVSATINALKNSILLNFQFLIKNNSLKIWEEAHLLE